MCIFWTWNPYLVELSDDKEFTLALRKAQLDIRESTHCNGKITIPEDEINLLHYKIMLAQMVRYCKVPSPSLFGSKIWNKYYLVNFHYLLMASERIVDDQGKILFHVALRVFLGGRYWTPQDMQTIKEKLFFTPEKLKTRKKWWKKWPQTKNWFLMTDKTKKQDFDWRKYKKLLKKSNFYRRYSPDDHSASMFVVEDYLGRHLKNLSTVEEYIDQEYLLLQQILAGHWKLRATVLRYFLFYLQQLRSIINSDLKLRIPEWINQSLFEELRQKEWWKTADKGKYRIE